MIRILALVGIAIAAIFVVDMSTPLGVAVPFLYLLPILLAIGARQSSRVILALVIVCTTLAVLKLLLPAVGGNLEHGQSNRLVFVVLIWALFFLEMARRQLEIKRQTFSQKLERLVQERTEALHRANSELQSEVAERKLAERSIQEYADRVHGLANRLVEVQEIERTHLAAELHDRIGQNLSALNISLNLNLAQLPDDTPPAVKARFRDALALLEQTTEIVRGVMEELHPALLDQYGLGAALRWYGKEFSDRTGLEVVHEMPELFPRLGLKVETSLFRIVQEALTNVAKHAGATMVTVSLSRIPQGVELRVSDNGSGMAEKRASGMAVGSGWGLTLMAERAGSIGARFQIDQAPLQGTSVIVTVPEGSWEENSHANHRTDR